MKKLFSFVLGVALLVAAVPVSAQFSDTPGTEASEAVKYLQDKGIVKGYSDGTYRPDQSITRSEFLKIALQSANLLDDACKEMPHTFSDVREEDWFFSVVCNAVNQAVVNGYPDGTFRPNDLINFAEASKIVANVKKLGIAEEDQAEWFAKYVQALQDEKVVPESIADETHQVTRGEMAEIIFGIESGKEIKTAARGALPEIESCEDLSRQLGKFSRRNQYFGYGLNGGIGRDQALEDAPTAAPQDAMKDFGGATAPDYSTTNVQEAGVDEADIIKNDGKYIYVLRGNTVRILQAVPAENLQEVGRINIEEAGFFPQEMYLDGSTLTVIGYSQDVSLEGDTIDKPLPVEPDGGIGGTTTPAAPQVTPDKIAAPFYYGKNFVKLASFNVADPKNPTLIRNVHFEGFYLTSRKVGDTVYMVVNKSNWYGGPILYDTSSESQVNLTNADLPSFYDSASTSEKYVSPCEGIRYVPNFQDPNFLILAAVNTKDTSAKVARSVLLGSGNNVYASPENIYVTAPNSREIYLRTGPNIGWQNSDTTQVFKFALDPSVVKFSAAGEVEGTVLNQFAMSEYNDNFRIATQKGLSWGGTESSSSIFILDSNLKEQGKIEGIAPGESLKATRFYGNKGYLVTFRNVDPLFVVDMNPTNPKIVGTLKIPGWSDYLQPYDENHLIGLGTEVSPDAEEKDFLTQDDILGLKLSLFDVSDLAHPKELFKKVIGARGSYSDALYNHKALLFEPAKGLIGFPVTITADKPVANGQSCANYRFSNCPYATCDAICTPSICNADGVCTSDCDGQNSCVSKKENIQTVFSGAQVYDVSLQSGFKLRGETTNFGPEWFENTQGWFYGDYERLIQRLVRIGEDFYSIAPNFVKSLQGNNLAEIKSVMLDQKLCPEISNEFDCKENTQCRPITQETNTCTTGADGNKVCTTDKQFLRCELK